MDKDQAYEIARQAVERLVRDCGSDATFPFDLVWQYADQDVPSTQRPHQANRLVKSGYLELTGEYTKAVSPDRAGSPTREYRPGPRFQPSALRAEAIVDTISEAIRQLHKAMDAQGLMITPAELANFYLALMTSPLVILAGLSGTGKSWIPRLFAQLIGADFTATSVQPQWSDNADLFGYTPSLNPSTFVEGHFTRALQAAVATPSKPAIVLLDEMNLAAVEHYFSDFLSVIETRRREGDAIITDSLPLDLPQVSKPDPYQNLRDLRLPLNARVVGTANMDETTRSFSPKVIDRAFVIEFDDVDLTSFPSYTQEEVANNLLRVLANNLVDASRPISVREAHAESESFFNWIAVLLEEIRQILRPVGISFGYRARDAILLYMWHWRKDGLSNILTADAAFDLCVLQKVLPKIAGAGEELLKALEALRGWLSETRASGPDTPTGIIPLGPFARSADKVERMLRRLEVEGATAYWGV